MCTTLEKFIAPRGSGRTTQICKYAILHDCDIIVPNRNNIQHIITVMMQICAGPNEYEYIGYNQSTNDIKIHTGIDTVVIHVFDAESFQFARFGPDRMKPVVIDDIDECMKHIIGSNKIAACSMATYNPHDVALTYGNDIGTLFRSLI